MDSQLKLAPSNGQVKLLSESWNKQGKKKSNKAQQPMTSNARNTGSGSKYFKTRTPDLFDEQENMKTEERETSSIVNKMVGQVMTDRQEEQKKSKVPKLSSKAI